MRPSSLGFLFWFLPLVIGGIVAAVNSDDINGATERAEAWARERQRRTAASTGRFAKYVLNPLLWSIVRFCDWTDGFAHRGVKNGARVAIVLYLVAAWLFALYLTVLAAVALVVVVIGVALALAAIYVGFKIIGAFGEGTASDNRSPQFEAARSSRSYRKTGMFTEDETGRTNEDGRVFRKTGMFTEEEVGRVDVDGTTYEKTGMFTEEETGRKDAEGRIFAKTGMFTEDEVGRVDADGRVFKKTGMFTEEETGRVERE